MGYPQGHKEKTRLCILQAARKLWKTKGYGGASVDKVMEEAGLTRGGFYAHFKSKDDLFVEALSETLASEFIQRLRDEGIVDVGEQRRKVVEYYLSPEHRDHPERGCPLTSLTQEAPRIGNGPKQVVSRLVRRFADWLAQDDAKTNGLAAVSLMVGAVTLSRATQDEALSDKILSDARKGIDRLLGTE